MSFPLPHQATVISIDGPAASGKSTVARLLAARLGFDFINSGSLYRALTYAVLQKGIDTNDVASIAEVANQAILKSGVEKGNSWVEVGGLRLKDELESPSVNASVSAVSSVQAVRAEVVRQLRAFADSRSIVMEGRDIGSVVFPETPWKFYIDASEEVRQMRRHAQGQVDSVRERDKVDSSRKTAPLMIPAGAVVLDSSHLSPTEVVDVLLEHLRRHAFIFQES